MTACLEPLKRPPFGRAAWAARLCRALKRLPEGSVSRAFEKASRQTPLRSLAKRSAKPIGRMPYADLIAEASERSRIGG